MLPSYRNQSIDLDSKSTEWFLYEGEKQWVNELKQYTYTKDKLNSQTFMSITPSEGINGCSTRCKF